MTIDRAAGLFGSEAPTARPTVERGSAASPRLHPPSIGLVLAGGRARRMGGIDKVLIRIGGRPILDRLVALLRPACTHVLLNANGDPGRYSAWSVPVIADTVPDFAGPLAGVLAGLDWAAAHQPEVEWVVTVPGDCPFVPPDLVTRLHRARQDAGSRLARARSGAWCHPVAGLWSVGLRDDMRRALTQEGLHKVEPWTARHGVATAEWPMVPVDPFLNINTPADVAEAERIAAQSRPA